MRINYQRSARIKRLPIGLAFPLDFLCHGSGKFKLFSSAFGGLVHLPTIAPTSRNPSVRAVPE